MNANLLSQSLKEKKLRLTHPRKKVYEVLLRSGHALSPKEVFEKISAENKEQTDLVSVYRNLSLFSELGIAHRFQDGRYAICKHDHSHEEEEDHHHDHVHILINCTKCGRSSEVHSHSDEVCHLAKSLKKYSSPLKEVQTIVIQGICSSCSY